MRQYELAIRIAQIHHLVDERKYKKALAVIQTLDVRQVRALSDLKVFAEVYTKTEQYDAAKAMYLRICRSSKTRRVLHRLVYLSIRTNSLEDAEAYFQEYMRMNPSTRDALILRYRIDKASGVPIGKLIEILQELKQEEYIEEWAYELAKLYHRAGRRDECMEECKDIMLWFGSGEIVERAKILMDHLKEKDPIPYYDDKDFTMPKKEAPNPYDTGSLPDLNEFIKERKALKREERKARRAAGSYVEDEGKKTYREEDSYSKEKEGPVKHDKGQEVSDTEFIDDYEEDDFEKDLVLPQAAIQKLSGLLKFGRKEEGKSDKIELPEKDKEDLGQKPEPKEREADFLARQQEGTEGQEAARWEKEPQEEREETRQKEKLQEREEEEAGKKEELQVQKKGESPLEPLDQGQGSLGQEGKASAAGQETAHVKKEVPKKKKAEYVPHSQSGTGITQDLAREITAIYEMEQQNQLKEKEVKVIKDKTDSKKARQQAGQEADGRKAAVNAPNDGEEAVTKPVKRTRAATGNPKDKTNIATNLVDRMTQAIQKSASKSYIPIDIEEIRGDAGAWRPGLLPGGKEAAPQGKAEAEKAKVSSTVALEKEAEGYQAVKRQDEDVPEKQPQNETELLKNLLEEEIQDPERLQEIEDSEIIEELEEAMEEELEALEEQEETMENVLEATEEPEEAVEEEAETTEEPKETMEEEAEATEELEETMEEEAEATEEPEEAVEEEAEATEEPEEAMGEEEPEVTEELEETMEEEAEATEEPEETVEEEAEATEEPEETVEEEPEVIEEQEEAAEEEELEDLEELEEEPERREEVSAATENTKDLAEEIEAVKAATSVLKDYHAPEIPVIETDYNEMPQITYEDLPTTRALQQSFQDVLRLIEGELDPSHFVLMGEGTERIVGVSKKIVHVMKVSGYLSVGRIAKIRAGQLNKMDLISFRKELKGNCLLIEEASDLLFPTITKIFSIMEEYYGDFVVILSDEGTTLDQLFRFVPVLAKRFKYIIDITKYAKKDYE